MHSSAAKKDGGEIVSFDSEELILVDSGDIEVGHLSKDKCHDGDGILHRAFSLFIFDSSGGLLLQQRSEHKRLWPLYWSNSCCSHPRRGETLDAAAHRRLHQELGMRGELDLLYKFIYRAEYLDLGTEHEMCSVYIGRSTDRVDPNDHEIADWRFVAPDELDTELTTNPNRYTPWVIMEWERLRRDHWPQIASL